MHRLRAGATTARRREVGSSVWQVFSGEGAFVLDGETLDVARGDVVVIPSWCPSEIEAGTDLDLFTFGDAPVYEALQLARHDREQTR
jgi:gentisate 1,2-dioxygenase